MIDTATSSRIVLLSVVLATALRAEPPKVELPQPSPLATLTQRVGLTDIEIAYSRPGMKDRKVFGEVVPLGKLWRTGANATTKLGFSTDVRIEGQRVPAGKYALFTIPGKSAWTVILSKDLAAAANKYDPKDDLLRVEVKPTKLANPVETFRIDVQDIRDESATLVLDWERTRVPIRLAVDVLDKVLPKIAAAERHAEKPTAGSYLQWANFALTHGLDAKRAEAWVDAGLAQESTVRWLLLHAKAKLLAKRGDKAGAKKAATESSELAVKVEGPDGPYARMNRDLIKSLK